MLVGLAKPSGEELIEGCPERVTAPVRRWLGKPEANHRRLAGTDFAPKVRRDLDSLLRRNNRTLPGWGPVIKPVGPGSWRNSSNSSACWMRRRLWKEIKCPASAKKEDHADMNAPRYPSLYQINARVWLIDPSQRSNATSLLVGLRARLSF